MAMDNDPISVVRRRAARRRGLLSRQPVKYPKRTCPKCWLDDFWGYFWDDFFGMIFWEWSIILVMPIYAKISASFPTNFNLWPLTGNFSSTSTSLLWLWAPFTSSRRQNATEKWWTQIWRQTADVLLIGCVIAIFFSVVIAPMIWQIDSPKSYQGTDGCSGSGCRGGRLLVEDSWKDGFWEHGTLTMLTYILCCNSCNIYNIYTYILLLYIRWCIDIAHILISI